MARHCTNAAGPLRYSEKPSTNDYVGNADDLIAAGIITADQLPGQPGRNKVMCTFINGVPVKRGANHSERDQEHYLSIKKRGRKFEVSVGVSDAVRTERMAILKAEMERNNAARSAAKYQAEVREAASKNTPQDFREACSGGADFVRMYMDGANGLYPFKFSAPARARIEVILGELDGLIRRSEVLPLHPEKVSAGTRGHLTLVWSVPSRKEASHG